MSQNNKMKNHAEMSRSSKTNEDKTKDSDGCSDDEKKKKEVKVVLDVEQHPEASRNKEPINHQRHRHANNSRLQAFSDTWARTVYQIRRPVLAFLHVLTQESVQSPKRMVLGIIFFSLALCIVGYATGFNTNVDEDVIWTPKDSRSIKHRDWIEDEAGFVEQTRPFVMTIHADGGNVLGSEAVKRTFTAIDAVRKLSDYDKVCADSIYIDPDDPTGQRHTCEILGITRFWGHDTEAFRNSAAYSSDEAAIQVLSARTYPDGRPVSETDLYGYPLRDENDLLVSAQLLVFIIDFPDTDEVESFESDALDVILDGLREDWQAEEGNKFRLEVQAWRSFGDEFNRAMAEDAPLLIFVFIIMSLFACIVYYKRNRVESRSFMGFGGVASVLLSLITGYGLMFLCQVPFTGMTMITPFIIFGIGLDDLFILTGSFKRTDHHKSTGERVHDMVEDVGLSVTLTTCTSTAAFGLGCLSSIPAIFWLCLYAFPSIVIVYLYQMTFVVAIIVIDEKRIQDGRRDCCFWRKADPDAAETPPSFRHRRSDKQSRFMNWYAKKLMHPAAKSVVIVAFAGLLAACIHSVTSLKQYFDFKDVLPDDSYVTDVVDSFLDYSERTGATPGVYFRYVDQSDKDMQEQMRYYLQDLTTIEAIDDVPEFFWLDDFDAFLDGHPNATVGTLPFNEQVALFLDDQVYKDMYDNDIIRDEDSNVLYSRCWINMDNFDWEDIKQQMDALEDQRAVSARQQANQGHDDWRFFTYSENYDLWEFYVASVDELKFTTGIGVAAVAGLALLCIPHWTATLFIAPLISILYLDVLGFIQWVGLDINVVSYIAMVMSIGLMVDFLMHVLLRYYESMGTRHERVIETLSTMGSSIFTGGISTLLGTIPLAFSTSAIFVNVFWVFLGLVIMGCAHGLILLPVLLSLIGPEDPPLVTKPESSYFFRSGESDSDFDEGGDAGNEESN